MAMSDRALCTFTPVDTWFFRESRPQGSLGTSGLDSVFPPPVRTLMGAVRTFLGDAWHARNGTSWRDFASNERLKAVIGFGSDLGPLKVRGAFLCSEGRQLYPAPASLMVKEDRYFLLEPGDAVTCDLGRVRLARMPARVAGLADLSGARPVEGRYLTAQGWQSVLAGQAPASGEVIDHTRLWSIEPRMGIGRDNARSAVSHGMLYQTRHVRPVAGVTIRMEVGGLPSDWQQWGMGHESLIRLGGEGRQAVLKLEPAPEMTLPSMPSGLERARELMLYNLTSVPCEPGMPAGVPHGFHRVELPDGSTAWEGDLAGAALRILGVNCARVQREGGWDLARHRAVAVESLLPAGSALHVEPLGPESWTALRALHGRPTGASSAWGRGLWVLGRVPHSS